MQVDISLDNARIYNIEKADIVKGQKFTLNSDYAETSHWFSDEDQVLSIKVTGSTAQVEAKELGKSTILIMNADYDSIKTLTFNVVESIEPMATDIGVSAAEPVNK